MRKILTICLSIYLAILFTGCAGSKIKEDSASKQPPENKNLILAMTTSIEDSGLLEVLIPAFENKTGYKVKTVSVGTGQALALAKKGEADALLVNSPKAEKEVVASGEIVNRRLVMHNDFVFVGPTSDQAKIKGKKDAIEALTLIAQNKALFVSRADDSGTNKLEKSLWSLANIKPEGSWYLEAGAGMGQTLKITEEKQGYTIADRATYIDQKKNLSLEILTEGDSKLLNLYHVMEVNPEKFSKVNSEGAKAFSSFLLSKEGQDLLAVYGKDKFGQPLYFVDGGKTEKDYGF